MRTLEAETQKLREELALQNRQIEDYITEVSTQLSQAEEWLADNGEQQPLLSDREDDMYQQALLQYSSNQPPMMPKASTGGSSKMRPRPH